MFLEDGEVWQPRGSENVSNSLHPKSAHISSFGEKCIRSRKGKGSRDVWIPVCVRGVVSRHAVRASDPRHLVNNTMQTACSQRVPNTHSLFLVSNKASTILVNCSHHNQNGRGGRILSYSIAMPPQPPPLVFLRYYNVTWSCSSSSSVDVKPT